MRVVWRNTALEVKSSAPRLSQGTGAAFIPGLNVAHGPIGVARFSLYGGRPSSDLSPALQGKCDRLGLIERVGGQDDAAPPEILQGARHGPPLSVLQYFRGRWQGTRAALASQSEQAQSDVSPSYDYLRLAICLHSLVATVAVTVDFVGALPAPARCPRLS